MTWVKIKPKESLNRAVYGIDWGTPRDVLLRKGRVTVWKTRGQTEYGKMGFQGTYYSPQWVLDMGTGPDGQKQLNDGMTSKGTPVRAKQWQSYLPLIAEAMGIALDQLPLSPPRGCTLVWEEAKS